MRSNGILYRFEETVKQTVLSCGMVKKGDRVLTALSGGADSTALLLSLLSLSETLSFSLCACHVNHGIRENAARDEAFCRALCERYGIPFFSRHADIPTLAAQNKESVETTARRERYRLLFEVKEREGCTKIATAHTLSDNAETVLFNLCGGCSPDGLCGIPPVRGDIIRPLYRLSRGQVEEYLSARGESHVTDETNFEDEYSRNFLRHHVIPKLKQLNPSFEQSVRRLSDSALSDKAYFEKQLSSLDAKVLSATEIAALDSSLARRYLMRLCRRELPDTRLSAAQTDALYHIVQKGSGSVSLPRKTVSVENGNIVFRNAPCEKTEAKSADGFHIPLKIGQNKINDLFCVVLTPPNEADLPNMLNFENNVYKLYEKIFVRYDIIVTSLYARNRLGEDKFTLGGMSRLLKKVFSSRKIPPQQRGKIPVVCDADGIVCVPFFSAPRDGLVPLCENKALCISFYAASDFFKEIAVDE